MSGCQECLRSAAKETSNAINTVLTSRGPQNEEEGHPRRPQQARRRRSAGEVVSGRTPSFAFSPASPSHPEAACVTRHGGRSHAHDPRKRPAAFRRPTLGGFFLPRASAARG
ncbi:hypothetical protein MRX96_054480 [Rhipicephalus microplus]